MEIVMADTGSDDGSREIAEKYADLVIDFPWVNDFSAARNAVLDHCSGTWHLAVDSDEWMEEYEPLVEFIKVPESLDYSIVLIAIMNYTIKGDNSFYSKSFGPRLCPRRDGKLRYKGSIHETPIQEGNNSAVMKPSIVLHHDGYAYANYAEARKKSQRNMELLQADLKRNSYSLMRLVQCLQSSVDNADKLRYAKRIMRIMPDKRARSQIAMRPGAYQNAILAANLSGEYDLACEWLEEGLKEYPDSLLIRIDGCSYGMLAKMAKDQYEDALEYGKQRRKALAEYEQLGDNVPYEFMSSWLNTDDEGSRRKYDYALLDCATRTEDWKFTQELIDERVDKKPEEGDNTLGVLVRISLLHTEEVNGLCYIKSQWNRALAHLEDDEEKERNFADHCAKMILSAIGNVLGDKAQEEKRPAALKVLASMGDCDPARCARIMQAEDPEIMRTELEHIENWEHVFIPALIHMIERAVPLSENFFKMPSELMAVFAMNIVNGMEDFPSKLLPYAQAQKDEGPIPQLLWLADLTAMAVRECKWRDEGEGVHVCTLYGQLEGSLLKRLYHMDRLSEMDLPALPAVHRFGWRLYHALEAIKRGDNIVYLHQLRDAAEDTPDMKNAAMFLCDNIDKVRMVYMAPELLEIADKVKNILAIYPEDDPAVRELKQSEIYKRVAWIIEASAIAGVARGMVK